jgi:3-methyladenine DNA glycosylase AlkD
VLTDSWVANVEAALRARADAAHAEPMRAYMKGIAPFLGIPAPQRRAAVKPLGRPPDPVSACRSLMLLPEREFHYVATEVITAQASARPASFLVELEWFIRTKSWWDTVDGIVGGVGQLVLAHPHLVARMDEWVNDADFWVARVAILHQLGLRTRTDEARLFRLCLKRADDDEFFLRKAIGWALRDYAWTNPAAVRDFLASHRAALSPLSVREASKNLDHPLAGTRR